MPITIIVENGTNVLNANSYNSIAELRSFALNRGIALSANNNAKTIYLRLRLSAS